MKKRTYGYNAGRRTSPWTDEDRYWIDPHELRRLRKFEAVVQHCEHGFRRTTLPPCGANGKAPHGIGADSVKRKRRSSALLSRLRGLHEHLAANINGQDHVLPRICSVLMRGELGFANPRRPKGTFLFVGPTGVGKTETTNVFTGHLSDDTTPIRFDMSEYQNQVSVEKLIGENRDDPGLLGRALRGVTRGTLLFDELEKSHPLVLDLFLQVVEDARLTLATGEVVDLRSFYVVFTSNIGSEETMRMENAPFVSVERTVLMRVRERLRPELIGRINEVVVFSRLDYATQRVICEAMIAKERARLAALGHQIEVGPDVVEFLVRAGYHRAIGARPMRGAVERYLQEAVVSSVLAGELGSGRVAVNGPCDGLIVVARRSCGVER